MLLGGGGTDVIDGGDGDDIEIQFAAINGATQLAAASGDRVTSATAADAEWVLNHVRIVNGTTVITIGGKEYRLAVTDLSQLVADATDVVATSEPTASTEPATSEPDEPSRRRPRHPAPRSATSSGSTRTATACRTPASRASPASSSGSSMPAGTSPARTSPTEVAATSSTPSTSGPFTLEVVIPDGYQPTLADAGRDDAVDSDANPAEVVVGPVETTVRVAVGDSARPATSTSAWSPSREPTAPDTTVEPTTTVAPAIDTTTTTAVPTTTSRRRPPSRRPCHRRRPRDTAADRPATVAPAAAPTTTATPTSTPAG